MIIATFLGGLIALLTASVAVQVGLRLADRMPRESLWPECLYCQRPARFYEALPLVGWLFRTKPLSLPCPCAQQKRQWAVPLAELAGLAAGIAAGAISYFTLHSPLLFIAVGLLPAIAVIDLLFGIIPDSLNLLLGLLGLGWLLLGGGELTIGLIIAGMLLLLGLVLAFGYSKLRGKDMLGLGDVKFFAAAGLWLTIPTVMWFLIIAGILGAINGLIWQRVMRTEQSPFAPALCLSLLGCLLYSAAQIAAP